MAGLLLAVYGRHPLRALRLDIFDRLIAPIKTRYVWDDLHPLFEPAGLDCNPSLSSVA